MPLYHDIIKTFKVLAQDGTVLLQVDQAHPSKVELKGGLGFTLVPSSDGTAIDINADPTAGANDPYYLQKFNNLVGGGPSGTPDYQFSGGPYYISKINDILPYKSARDRDFSVVGSGCMQVGIFQDTRCLKKGVPSIAYPETDDNKLQVTNMCQPDVDCEDYRRIYIYLERIRKFLDANKDANLQTGTNPMTGTPEIALYKQYQAAVHYWNFVVLNKGFTFTVIDGGRNNIAITTGYEVVSCGSYSNPSWSILITEVSGTTVTIKHDMIGFRSSRPALRPHPSGNNPLLISIYGTMKLRDYVLVNSVAQIDLPGSALASHASAATTYATFNVTVTWMGTAIGTSSLTKQVTIAIADRRT